MSTYSGFRCDYCRKTGRVSFDDDTQATLEKVTITLRSPYLIKHNGGSDQQQVTRCIDTEACGRRETRASDAREKMLRDSRSGQAGWDE